MNFIGIDPGNQGFITLLMEDGSTQSWPMPIGKNEKVDGGKLFEIFDEIDIITNANHQYYIEDVHAIFGSSAGSTFSFGYGLGKLHGVLEVLDIEYNLIQPKMWQKIMWAGYDIEKMPSKSGKQMVNDTKATSIRIASKLYPDVDLRKSTRARKPHDGKCDSLLIATCGMRMYNKMK